MELLGHAPNESVAWAGLIGLGMGQIVRDRQGVFHNLPVEGVQIWPVGEVTLSETDRASGFHFNLRFYGPWARALQQYRVTDPETGVEDWNMDALSAWVASQLKETVQAVEKGQDKVKARYKAVTSEFSIFSDKSVRDRHCVWAS